MFKYRKGYATFVNVMQQKTWIFTFVFYEYNFPVMTTSSPLQSTVTIIIYGKKDHIQQWFSTGFASGPTCVINH